MNVRDAFVAFYFNPSASPEGRATSVTNVVSLLALGCAALGVVSVLVPFFRPPFGGDYYLYWILALTVILAVVAALRRERGPLAFAAALVGFCSLTLALALVAFAFGISAVLRSTMPD